MFHKRHLSAIVRRVHCNQAATPCCREQVPLSHSIQPQCLQLCCNDIWEAAAVQPEVDEDQCLLLNAAPTCPRCGGLARPNVLIFTDFEWLSAREEAQARRMENWLAGVRAPVVVEIGAGTAIPSVREFSQRVIHEFGGRLIRINPRECSVPTPFDVGFAYGAAQALKAIDQAVQETAA